MLRGKLQSELFYEDLIDRYKTYGFSRLEKELEEELHKRLKPLYDDDCKFMYRML